MTTKAQQNRLDTLRVIGDRYGHMMADEMADHVEEILEDIRALYSIGRTTRWQRAVAAWANSVNDNRDDPRWAFFQYGIYAGYAAL